jgi:tetratricopeptide (TPR) repeat protein
MTARLRWFFVYLMVLLLFPVMTFGRSASDFDIPQTTPSVGTTPYALPTLKETVRFLREGEITLQEEPLNAAKTYFEACVQGPDAVECQYQLSRIHLGLSVMHKLRKESKQGRQELEEALKWAKAAEKADGSSAKVHTLLADLWGERLIEYGGVLAGPRFGPKVKNENSKAVSLAPHDPIVLAGLGRQYLLAPKAFGGDVPKAIELFKRSLEKDPDSSSTYVWLARAYRKIKDRDGFNQALKNALRLQPENIQAQREQSQWSDEKD